MEHINTKVLAAGIERMTFEKLAPVLRRDAVKVEWVATPEAGVKLAGENRYDVILMDAVPCDWSLEKVVRSFRDSSSPSRNAAILVLAEPDQVDVARALRSRGVNRVMLVTDPPEIIPHHKVWPRLGSLARENGGKLPSILRKGRLIRVKEGRYCGIWRIASVKRGKKPHDPVIDMVSPDDVKVESKAMGQFRDVRVRTLIKNGLEIIDTPLTGINACPTT